MKYLFLFVLLLLSNLNTYSSETNNKSQKRNILTGRIGRKIGSIPGQPGLDLLPTTTEGEDGYLPRKISIKINNEEIISGNFTSANNTDRNLHYKLQLIVDGERYSGQINRTSVFGSFKIKLISDKNIEIKCNFNRFLYWGYWSYIKINKTKYRGKIKNRSDGMDYTFNMIKGKKTFSHKDAVTEYKININQTSINGVETRYVCSKGKSDYTGKEYNMTINSYTKQDLIIFTLFEILYFLESDYE